MNTMVLEQQDTLSAEENIFNVFYQADTPLSISSDGNDLSIKWEFADRGWMKIFGRAGLRKQYELRLSFDAAQKTFNRESGNLNIVWPARLDKFSLQKRVIANQSATQYGVKSSRSVGENVAALLKKSSVFLKILSVDNHDLRLLVSFTGALAVLEIFARFF